MSASQIAAFKNAEYGVTSLVTKISKGYAVTLWDDDAEMAVEYVTIYPFNMMAQAINYAKQIAGVPA
jgi:hypothetical protein